MKFADLLRKNRKDVALIIGNGIHQFSDSKNNSWDSLLATLSNRNGLSFDKVPKGASATEFFDVLALKSTGSNDSLARAFCDLMGSWKALSHHKKIVSWAIRNRVPILTTNFDEVLGNAAGIKLMRPKGKDLPTTILGIHVSPLNSTKTRQRVLAYGISMEWPATPVAFASASLITWDQRNA
ncbi:hypothetical protein QP162_13265 [Sphingomonas aurantiaca]|uniref:hypothetical protein n=1 Tax=Sphingomonas aurantiaca TaxID=185949 RepID=UPI002FE2352A